MPPRRVFPVAAILGALATGLAFAFSQPPLAGWPLAFVCLAPLLAALRGRGAVGRAALGALAGSTAAWLATTPPLATGLERFFGLSAFVAWPLAGAAGALLLGGAFALFALLAGDPARSSPGRAALRAAAAFAASEFVRVHVFGSPPWLLLGHALAPAPAWAGLAALGGTALVSFWLAAWSGCVVAGVRGDARSAMALGFGLVVGHGLGVLALPDASHVPGRVRVARADDSPRAGALRVGLVQSGIPNAWRRQLTRLPDAVDRLVALSQRAPDADLWVWPENALHVHAGANGALLRDIAARGLGKDELLLLGAPRSEPPAVFASAVLLDDGGRMLAVHDKVGLVPFSERLPGPLRLLGFGRASLTPGDRPRAMAVGPHRVGALICYEMLLPAVSRQLVRDGAGVLINLGNDAWFGLSGGRRQHLAAAVLRAVEFGRPVLRATPSGITAAIDSRGHVVAALPEGVPRVLRVDVWPAEAMTLYARTGDGVGPVCLVAALLATTRRYQAKRIPIASDCSKRSEFTAAV